MRVLAYVLIGISLIAGSLAAATAYVPTLAAVAASPTTLTLNAPAGHDPAHPDRPLVSPDDQAGPVRLTPSLVGRLAAQHVRRVRVKEFALGRWEYAGLFGLAMVGLFAGGLLVRRDDRRHAAAHRAAAAAGAASPAAALAGAHAETAALAGGLADLSPSERAEAITRGVDGLQERHLAAFAAARSDLLRRYGMAGFARLMDPFAAAERQLHRAWSAAADGAVDEAETALAAALEWLERARARLDELATSRRT